MAVAEPVEVGARLSMPERARRRSDFFVLGMSTRVCVPVTLWIVVMQQWVMPRVDFITFITGARQLVVQEALVIILWEEVRRWSWTTAFA